MSTISSLISSGGGGGSNVNDIKFTNNTDSLITTESDEVWLKGGVTETDVATYPDATSNFAYSGVYIVVGAQGTLPYGATWDGTYFWILNNQTVYKYSAAAVSYTHLTLPTTPYV